MLRVSCREGNESVHVLSRHIPQMRIFLGLSHVLLCECLRILLHLVDWCVSEVLGCLTDCPESPVILLFCYRQTGGSFNDWPRPSPYRPLQTNHALSAVNDRSSHVCICCSE